MSHSDSAARTLVDFLNHGILPFIGRAEEAERIHKFWKGTYEAQGLRAALLVGEAGVGKSRVVERAIGMIAESGGTAIHVKLYPGGATALPPLIARALVGSRAGAHPADGHRQTSSTNPSSHPLDDRLPAVIASLQRTARLRPTMLIVEDIHLLNDDSLGDFATLLHALSDEAISILAVARPVDFLPRGVLERYLVGEIRVGGLTVEELRELWRRLFGNEARPVVIGMLESATNGNPLAIRSALRGALTSGAIDQRPNGGWEAVESNDIFAATLERGVEVLAEGMAAHLTPEERRAAEGLAALGEIFSREGAAMMIDDADRLLELLIFKGIITVAGTAPAPLAGKGDGAFPASNHPLLAFTHSLVHRRFIQQADVDMARVLDVIGSDAPLYSTLPFELLAARRTTAKPDGEQLPGEMPLAAIPPSLVQEAATRIVALAYDLDESPDWKLALKIVQSGFDLIDLIGREGMPDEELHNIESRLMSCKLSLMRREQHTPEFRELVRRFLDYTADPTTIRRARHRLMALSHIYRFSARWDRERCPAIWDEVDELIGRYPQLGTSRPYITFLRDVALDSRREADLQKSRKVEERLTALLESPEADERTRHIARKLVAPFLLVMFTTEQELERRKEMLAELERMPDEVNSLYLAKMQFLMSIGEMEQAVQVCRAGVARMRERGLDRSWVHGALIQIYAETALGLDFASARRRLLALRAESSAPALHRLCESAGLVFSEIAMLRNAPDAMEEILSLFPEALMRLPAELAILRALRRGNDDAIGAIAAEGRDASEALLRLLAALEADRDTLRNTVNEALAMRVLRTNDLLSIHAMLEIVAAIARRPDGIWLAEEARPAAANAVRHALGWIHERKLPHFMDAVIERHGGWLPAKERAEWVRRRDGATRDAAAAEEPGRSKLRLSMLGMVQIVHPDGEVSRPRGARVRALLALMVADRMLERPLEHREFCRLASDNQDDPEHARKVVNVSVFRLRELLGQDAILTDQETPRLNLEKVEVDLLEAAALLGEVEEAMAKGSLMRAHTALLKALDTTRGEVPFPSLYDGFFEAARADFSTRLRAAALDVARGLIYEGDILSAHQILQRILSSMPGDVEIRKMVEGKGKR